MKLKYQKKWVLIVRTAGSNKTKNEINQDLETLKNGIKLKIMQLTLLLQH